MEIIAALVVIYLIAALVILPVWILIKLGRNKDELRMLDQRQQCLEEEIRQLRFALSQQKTPPAQPSPPPLQQAKPEPAPVQTAQPPVQPLVAAPRPHDEARMEEPIPLQAREETVPLPITEEPRSAINWEQFMGAKLFAWLGGLALFLGAAFFVKYSFEHDLIPPEVRVALGFLLGLGLLVGGLRMAKTRYLITAHTLMATGVVTLYAVTFACNAIYHFALFGTTPTFLLMSLITVTAFLLAVRLDAQVVAVLGILGGFLTPVLINTGRDNPGGLFGYIALLVAGLGAVALHRGWLYLVSLGAAGTALMIGGWADKFFVPAKTITAMVVCLSFTALFLLIYELARRLGRAGTHVIWSAVGIASFALAYALFFVSRDVLAVHPGLLFGYIFLIDAAFLTLASLDERTSKLHFISGMAVFVLISIWNSEHLAEPMLNWALGINLVFAALHSAFPLLLERLRPAAAPTWWSQLFPPLTLVLLLIPVFRFEAPSFLIWPVILLVDAMAVGLALLSASLVGVAMVLLLSLAATCVCVFRAPTGIVFEPGLLLVIGAFAVFFFAASLWLAKRLGERMPSAEHKLSSIFGDTRAQLPAFSSLLPFVLLIMVSARLNVPDPSALFGLGLLLTVLTLGLTRLMVIEWLPACALAGLAALEWAWHSRHFAAGEAVVPLAWYLGFYLLFTLYPFAFRKHFSRLTGPWAVAALAGFAQFGLVHRTIKAGWPNEIMGLIPAAFAVAPLLSLMAILRSKEEDNPKRLSQLAWYGGMALAFITLIFPIQFEKQWITIGWALEGVALLWLFHRVPHPGLRIAGVLLLLGSFARLALNPAVLEYQVRGGTPVLNWYLYAYGLTVAALFTGARLLAPPRENVLGANAPRILGALGIILAFLLLNIEIADFFSPAGSRSLLFRFTGSFALDMSYTIGWSLFAFGLLIAGIWKKEKAVRYAAIALLSVALLKLFLHDLARLEALYRIGALFAVAVIAILASFAYQRFLPGNEKNPPPQP